MKPDQDEVRELDQQFRALMEGLRATLPGIEVLFGFLLVLPFQPGFAEVDRLARGVHYVAVTTAALAIVLLLAPSAHQRVRALITGIPRRHERHVRVAIQLANVGTGFIALSLGSSLYVVSAVVFESMVAWISAGVFVVLAVGVWFYLPGVRWRDDR